MTQKYTDGSWGGRVGFGQKPAIIVIDMTRAFTEPHRPLGSDMSSEITTINALITEGRSHAIPIIFTKVAYETEDYADAGLWMKKVGGQHDLLMGGDGIEVDPRLCPGPRDMILHKKYASIFFGTDLVSRLVSHGIDTLIIVGCSTSGCVRASAVDAIQYGFRPIVVESGVADRWLDAHQQALRDLQAKYADVVPYEIVLKYFDDLPATHTAPKIN
jgi:maleamate amidohydrolase